MNRPTSETAAIALLRALVQQDSINPPGVTKGVAGVALDWLHTAGFAPEVVSAHPNKPNIVVTLDNGPGPHLVFNAHLDTISPGEPSAWTRPIHDLTEGGGRLYGLGTGNMKAAAAAMMLATLNLSARRDDWTGRLSLTLVADECVFGPDGAAFLLSQRPDLLGDMLICGEGPGYMHLAIAEKGLMWVKLTATGPAGQGMLSTAGSTATTRLAVAITALDEINRHAVPCPLAVLDHTDNTAGLRPSVNVGRIGGGTFISQAASSAWAEIDIRLPPGLSIKDMSVLLDSICQPDYLTWEIIKAWDANWSAPDCNVASAILHAAREVGRDGIRMVTRLPASDASRWRKCGISSVCFGPQAELASGVDDHVYRQDFLDCIQIYENATLEILGIS